ncbi:hypothetical protein DFJ58DRAFT_715865 [Suillus subalutaceus]|uniref:uncharacterized protein n=1 Tax=Suillus subalutaceus TaxID=48586 RepID=UPI001B8700AB|nr:uncharacterized protein DFJ58DRAFT_715865 [Suillus subalutaceus]KAG1858447.1 hypothetical protein DFJ58DRAFT_715865 [Suillus subalutaceus]
MLDKLEDDQYAYRRKINPYYPFPDEGEWELGRFLAENLTQTQITKFLKLRWFDTPDRAKPSFTTKDNLLDWMDSLPSFTPWKVSKLEFKGYKTVRPVELVWRDALEVVKQLFSDPTFANNMTFHPHVANVNNQREYGDYMSADMAWKIQDHLPLGATQVPIILGSNKTPVTRLAGGIEMHPVFVTIGNIDSEVRSKATLRAWRCVAYISVVKFRVHPDYQSILQARLWHKCMDLVCANLKAAAKDGCFMPDPSRNIRHVFTPLVGHVDPWDLDKFQKAAKAINLSGVHMPYWRDWMFACPSVFLAGEEAMGDYELDTRFMVQHKRVGTHHFTKGITHHRDIQRTIVASIAGAVPPRFIRAIRALNPVHSPQSLELMVQALSDFHSFKDAIIQAEARRGKNGSKEDFFVPKLELLQSFDGTIKKLGTLMQFSTDMTEQLLITHCKDLFPWTSRQIKDFTEQCMRILNCQESMEMFGLYTLLTSRGASLANAIHDEDEDVTTTNPALSCVSRVLPDEVKSIHGPRPVRNHFLKGILSGDALTTFQLNVAPDYKSLSPSDICTKYALFDFDLALTNFICCSSLSGGEHSHWDPRYGRFQAWHKFRLQLHSAFQPRVIMPSRVVQAYPPSDDFPLGNYNTVLIDTMGVNGKMTSYIGQVRLIFQPIVRQGSNLELPSYLSDPLLYVQFFRFTSGPDDHPELAMWSVERAYTQDENGNCHREGAVVRVTDVTHVVELIPVYGEAVAKGVSSATCLESYKCFFLNNFADKESYHTFSTEFV